jgi:uncharacterized protein (TIGR02611 family)
MDPVHQVVAVGPEPVDAAEPESVDVLDVPAAVDTLNAVDDAAHPLPPIRPARRVRVARQAKRVGVGVAGTSVLGAGVAMLVLPGPGLVVIVAGLAILATEFAWAERRLDQAKAKVAAATDAAKGARRRRRSREP